MATSTSTTTPSTTTNNNTTGGANINANADLPTATTITTTGADAADTGPTTSTFKPEPLTNSTSVTSSNSASNNLTTLPNTNQIKATNTTSNNNNNNNINTNSNKNQATNGSFSDSHTSTEGHRTPNVENLSKTNLYIRGLSANTSDQDLYNICAKFGNIFSTKAIQDKVNGGCKGYGFVQFTSPQSAELAVQELTKTGIQAQMARISSSNSSHNNHHHHHHHHHNNHHHHHPHNNHYNQNQGTHHQHNNSNNHNSNPHSHSHSHNSSSNSNNHTNSNNADPTNLYIANLPVSMTEQELENLLSGFGPVVSTRILRDPNTNDSRGVGFARMESRDKCQEIIDKLNGKPFRGSKEHLLVKFADGGIKKRHHHNNHHNNNNNNFQQHHKVSQDENRWRGNTNVVNDLNNLSNFEQGNISHSNQLPDLAIMSTLSYPRLQPSFPPPVGPGSAYNPAIDPSTSGQQWIHPAAGQPWNMIPQQMIHSGGMNPSSQAAAGFPFAHISQLTSQMQGLQLAHHPGAPVGGYLPPHHQWPGMWPHGMPQHQHQQHQQQPHQRQQQQPQPTTMRMVGPIQQQPPQVQQKQHPSPSNPQQQSATVSESPAGQKQQNPVGTEGKLQIPAPL